MNVQQVLEYPGSSALEVTWENDGEVVRVHAYSGEPAQLDQLREDLGPELDKYMEYVQRLADAYRPAPARAPVPLHLTPLEFLDLFTPTEQRGVAQAAMQDVGAKVWYDRTLAARYITLEDPRTAEGIEALVGLGLLDAGRKDAILAGLVG